MCENVFEEVLKQNNILAKVNLEVDYLGQWVSPSS